MKLNAPKVRSLMEYLKQAEVEVLRVFMVSFDPAAMKVFVELIRDLKNLRELWLRSFGFESLAAELLLSLRELPRLESVELDGIPVSPENLPLLIAFLEAKPDLKSFYFDGNGQTGLPVESLYFRISQMRNLSVLQTWEFDGTHIQPYLAPALTHLPQLTKLVLQYGAFEGEAFGNLARCFSQLRNLQELHLEYNEFGVRGAEALAAVLPELKYLEYLNLSGNSIEDTGLRTLAHPLSSLPCLKTLYLTYNSLTANSAQDIEGLVRSSISLRELHIDENALQSLDFSCISATESLRKLNAAKCQLEDSAFLTFPSHSSIEHLILNKNKLRLQSTVEHLLHIPHLKTLSLASNALTHDSLAIHETSLEVIDLSGTDLTPGGIQAFRDLFLTSPSIKELHLNDLGLTSETLGYFMTAFEALTRLEKLSLGNNFLEDADSSVLANSLRNCLQLKELDLNMNHLTARGAENISKLAASIPGFEQLNLVQNQITETAHRSLLEIFPNVIFTSVN
eukprot:CAMPEP_0204901564 /NCGR_PEP_ID=MMETSP1397-20131031/3153_1 /ASSEMBLY_ACC=CAM_ASM_000891 /TAXON_ID=49980 /ORGANISM="Climacostomum Climacostomum virens, Strain Stock W-24" /LENGTH=508 /DNA_ID=CAMNT_0052069937 /DNA_START=110 /DNA_END=1636 /DNA_ORIENTATION=+